MKELARRAFEARNYKGCTWLAKAVVPPGSCTNSPAAAQHGSAAAATAARLAASQHTRDLFQMVATTWQVLQLQSGASWLQAASVSARLNEAQAAAASQARHMRVQAGLKAGHAAWAATRASEAASRQALLEQLQQGMAGYPWEPEDWEWRPTVIVVEAGRLGFRAAQQLLDGNKQQRPELVSKVQLVPVPLRGCLCACGDLGTDSPAGIVGDGSAAAPADGQEDDQAGSSSVLTECDAVVHVVSPEQQQQQQQHAERPGQAECAGSQAPLSGPPGTALFYLERPADIVVTDLLDYSVLGQGLLPTLQAAAAKGLITPDALTVPSSVSVQGQLVNTALTHQVSGFDLSLVNKYKWHPTIERTEHDRRAVNTQRQRLQQAHSAAAGSEVHVLDIGTGTGLLSMMAAR
ncbi:hypothetical protein COO60DRAFT_1457162 [Scenedesmus sp. NREL 46B-D3]|nr:hypothetical protein COO60DRAFT_1457162 [Scenedesmus sp. NREL 46B-D3]